MKNAHHSVGTKRCPINLTVSEAALKELKALGINASRAAEDGMRQAIRRAKEAQWLEAHQSAIAAHNASVEAHGVPLKPLWQRDDAV